MGSLFLGSFLLSLVGLAAKKTLSSKSVSNTSKAVPHTSAEVTKAVAAVSSTTKAKEPTSIKRNEIRTVYEQQEQVVSRHLDVPAHTPYVVGRTTVLGNYLHDDDWQALASDSLGEAEFLARLEANFDHEVHMRLQRAAEKAKFVNVRAQVKSGPKQVASFSDGKGHGVRVAINHAEESQIGVDLIGYEGTECESKREELLEAMAAEGLVVRDIRTIPHNDPKGYQGRKRTQRRGRSNVLRKQRQHSR